MQQRNKLMTKAKYAHLKKQEENQKRLNDPITRLWIFLKIMLSSAFLPHVRKHSVLDQYKTSVFKTENLFSHGWQMTFLQRLTSPSAFPLRFWVCYQSARNHGL